MFLISFETFFSFLRFLKFCPYFLDHVGKRLDKKALFHKKHKNSFKIYDVTDWTANNFNTHNAQYLKK